MPHNGHREKEIPHSTEERGISKRVCQKSIMLKVLTQPRNGRCLFFFCGSCGSFGGFGGFGGSELLVDRCLDAVNGRDDKEDKEEDDDVTDRLEPADITDAEDGIDDRDNDHKAEDKCELCTEDTPFIAVGDLVGFAEGFQSRHVFVHKEDRGKAESDGNDHARNEHEHEADTDGADHEGHEDKELAHVLAVLTFEDKERVDRAAFCHFSRERAHSDGGSDVEVRDPESQDVEYGGQNEAQEIHESDGDSILDGSHDVNFFHNKLLIKNDL